MIDVVPMALPQDPEALKRRRRVAEAMMSKGLDTSQPIQSSWQGVDRVAKAWLGALQLRQLEDEQQAGMASAAALGGPPSAGSASGVSAGLPPVSAASTPPNVTPEIKDGISQTASALGISPVDLATTISYETGGTFDPTKAGPTTKWGQHRGLIQFGEPQAKQYGVDWNNPVASQLGPNGAVAAYLRDRGVKPGMGLMDIYSTINAGAPGLYNRSDAAAGGAPGTVADKVNNQMNGHRAKAMALFANAADLPAAGASPVEMDTGLPGFAVPPGPDASGAMPAVNPMGDATGLDMSSPAALPAAAPVLPQGPAPAMDGQTFNMIAAGGQPLDPTFQTEGTSQPWMGTALPVAPAPAPAAPQMASVPLPPPRPADLATPQADLPAPGAVPTIGQLPAAAAPLIADPTKDNAGVLSGLVASEEARKGLPSGAGITSPFAGIVQALTGNAAPAAAPSPAVAKVAAALPQTSAPAVSPSPAVSQVAAASQPAPQQVPAVAPAAAPQVSSATNGNSDSERAWAARVIAHPYATATQRAIAQSILTRDPNDTILKRQQVEKGQREAENAPLTAEGLRLEIESKRKALNKPEPPITKEIEGPDGTKTTLQWDGKNGTWIVPPQAGGGAPSAPKNPYALPGKPTESQSKDAGFAGRMVESHNLINQLEGVGLDKTQAAIGAIPFVGNAWSSSDKQRFEQAKRNFVTAILRKESGAAISQSEFDQAEKTYFPQIGDKPEKIEQLRRARELAIEGVMAGAGSGYKVPDSYKPSTRPAAPAAPDRAALEAEARRRGLIK